MASLFRIYTQGINLIRSRLFRKSDEGSICCMGCCHLPWILIFYRLSLSIRSRRKFGPLIFHRLCSFLILFWKLHPRLLNCMNDRLLASKMFQIYIKFASQLFQNASKLLHIFQKNFKHVQGPKVLSEISWNRFVNNAAKMSSAQKYLAKFRGSVPSSEKYVSELKFCSMQSTRLYKHI